MRRGLSDKVVYISDGVRYNFYIGNSNGERQMKVNVHSDLYNAGLTEDGREYHAEMYYVIAEDDVGHRWAHKTGFYSAARHSFCDEDGDGVVFEDLREEMKKRVNDLCSRIAAHLASGGTLDLDHWNELPPAYGSQAYQTEGGNEEMYQWERSQEGL